MPGTKHSRYATPFRSWVLSALFGAVAPLFTSLGLVIGLAAIGVIAALAVRQAGLIGISGVLTGFGLCWTLLMARVLMGPGGLDNGALWLALGLVSLVAGFGVLTAMARRPRSHRQQ